MSPKNIPEEPMNSTSQIEPFPLGPETTGHLVAEAHLTYLKSTVRALIDSTEQGLIQALKDSSGTTLIDMTDDEWKQLAVTALTIGSSALDKIEKKLSLQAAKYHWAKGYDYRPIATQIHTIATPARKIINGLNFRAKCVRAVIKVQTAETAMEEAKALRVRSIIDLKDIVAWQADSYAVFEKDKTVHSRFHPNYKKEWTEFCEEWNASKIDMRYYSGNSLESIYQKYLSRLTEESNKSNIKWEPVLQKDGRTSRPDGILGSGFPFELKRKPGQLTFAITIPTLTDSELHATALDLMDVIEKVTGLENVEIGFNGAKDPNILEVILFGSYTSEQSKLALNEIDTYLKQHFSDRT